MTEREQIIAELVGMAGWMPQWRLLDSQWTNIVNNPRVSDPFLSTPDAVAAAMALTEKAIWENMQKDIAALQAKHEQEIAKYRVRPKNPYIGPVHASPGGKIELYPNQYKEHLLKWWNLGVDATIARSKE